MAGVEQKTVLRGEDGMRLDRWFKTHYVGLPHSRLEKLLRTGQVRVDGGRAKASTRLAEGQTIRVPPLPDAAPPPSPKQRLSKADRDFLAEVGFETAEFTGEEAALFRDLDRPEDLFILNQVFRDVEPLPVSVVSLSKGKRDRDNHDVVAEEWPVAVFVNGLKLVTVMCLPTALREMAVGLAAYLGLVKQGGDIQKIEVDYAARRVLLDLSASDDDIRNASQVLISSTCGASVYGGQI
jgi:hypothetical protein